jgi:hypothetical protein
VSYFSSIGFPIALEEFKPLVTYAAEKGETVEAGHGTYVRWSTNTGAELWLKFDRDRSFIGVDPHFSGAARMRIRLEDRVERADRTVLDGAFYGWPDPSGSDPELGDYPLVFDAPDYDLYGALELPAVVDVQLAAFALVLKAFSNDEQYAASRAGAMMAVESFFPSGLFENKTGQEGELVPAEQPQALVVLSGRVLNTSQLTNPATRSQYFWARVRTYGGEIEVVASPDVVEGTLIQGGVINGLFWLSGLLLEHRQTENNGLWNR